MYNNLINIQKHEVIVKYFTAKPKEINIKKDNKLRHILKIKKEK